VLVLGQAPQLERVLALELERMAFPAKEGGRLILSAPTPVKSGEREEWEWVPWLAAAAAAAAAVPWLEKEEDEPPSRASTTMMMMMSTRASDPVKEGEGE